MTSIVFSAIVVHKLRPFGNAATCTCGILKGHYGHAQSLIVQTAAQRVCKFQVCFCMHQGRDLPDIVYKRSFSSLVSGTSALACPDLLPRFPSPGHLAKTWLQIALLAPTARKGRLSSHRSCGKLPCGADHGIHVAMLS